MGRPFLSTTLKINGVAQQEFYIAGDRYMALVSQDYISESENEADGERSVLNSKLL